jgi:plastocyanin
MSMKYILIIIIIAVAGAFFLFRDGTEQSDSGENVSGQAQSAEDSGARGTEALDDSTVDITADLGDEAPADIEDAVIVTYTGAGFSPSAVTISRGQSVRFVNESAGNMWVASAMHPTHIVYSGTNLDAHCPDTIGEAFDQCESGDEYAFTFMKAGEWGYHDHINPSAFGKIIVE